MEPQSNQNNIPSATAPADETIFGEMLDTKRYEKSLKNARIYLYIIAALQVVVGIYQYSQATDTETAIFLGGIPIALGLLFLVYAFWSYKKPVVAFMTALVTFVAAHLITMIDDPTSIYKGIILKVLVVVALVKAYKDAREVEKLKESMGE